MTRGEKLLSMLALILALLFKSCGSNDSTPVPDKTKPIRDTIRILETKVVVLDSTRTKLVYKWRTITDTISLRDTVSIIRAFNLCDTIIVKDSTEIVVLKDINKKYVSIFRIYSLKIDSLTRSKKKFWKGFKSGFVAGSVFTGSIIWTTAIK